MQSKYEATIGLEIHAELNTQTKMFCLSKNDPDETSPNTNTCPVCLAHPGTLPVINRQAVKHVLRVGIALGSTLADYTEFDRKNYFYPDLPKGYQISQFEYPLVSGGILAGVPITRVHLEEDTASSIHDESTGATLIDYNRSGVPLMELVSEPAMHSAEQAGTFARELQTLLRYLGASNANMEKGEMRVEANVSVAKVGERSAAYVEIKNLNSFRTMERAIAYEITRQEAMLERGEKLIKQTLGWDEAKQATFPQRTKEGSADYRYFPDPDLPSLRLSEIEEFNKEALKADIPELPGARRDRYINLGLQKEDADLYVIEPSLGNFFDEVIYQSTDQAFIKLVSNYIANDLVKIIRDSNKQDSEIQYKIPITSTHFKKIVELVFTKKISSRSAKDLLLLSISDERDPEEIAKDKNLFQITSTEGLKGTVQAIIDANPNVVADYKAGKAAALEYLVGQSMRSLRGAADADVLRTMFQESLK